MKVSQILLQVMDSFGDSGLETIQFDKWMGLLIEKGLVELHTSGQDSSLRVMYRLTEAGKKASRELPSIVTK